MQANFRLRDTLHPEQKPVHQKYTICQHKIKTSAWKSKNLTIIVPKHYHTWKTPETMTLDQEESNIGSRTSLPHFLHQVLCCPPPAPQYIVPRVNSCISEKYQKSHVYTITPNISQKPPNCQSNEKMSPVMRDQSVLSKNMSCVKLKP